MNSGSGELPNNKEYEQGLLGALINDARLYNQIADALSSDDFYVEKHRIIYSAIKEMSANEVPVDILTLWEHLKRSGEIEIAGQSSYLTYLSQLSADSVNVVYYAAVIKQHSDHRRTWRILVEGAKSIESGEGDRVARKVADKLQSLDSGKNKSSLKPVSAKDLENLPPPESLWADIIYPGSIIQLNFEPGIGKSTLAYNICSLGALGEPFLNIGFKKKIKSLYADLETPKSLRRNKIKLISGTLPENFHILDELNLKRDIGELVALCKRESYDLVVLDTQSRVFSMERENDNAEANFMAGLLRRITNTTGAAVLLIHHTTKGDGGSGVYRGRGASAIAGAVDVVINMKSLSEDTLKLSVEKHRIQGSLPNFTIRKAGGDRFEQCANPADGSQSGFEIYRVQDLIVEMLTEHQSMKTGEIIEAVMEKEGASKRMVQRALSGLCQSGKIFRQSRGVYSLELPSDNPATLYTNGNVASSGELFEE